HSNLKLPTWLFLPLAVDLIFHDDQLAQTKNFWKLIAALLYPLFRDRNRTISPVPALHVHHPNTTECKIVDPFRRDQVFWGKGGLAVVVGHRRPIAVEIPANFVPGVVDQRQVKER